MYADPKERIDDQALKVWRLSGAIDAVIYGAALAVLLFLTVRFDWPVWIAVVAAVLAICQSVLEIVIWPKLKYNQWRYEITENEIELKHGIVFRKRTSIPMIRIQHVDTKQGPLLRRFGLATVTFSTAAGSHEIPALTELRADQARKQITYLARLSDEEI
ncbi:hypothetical protein EBB07_12625 [Paenibacillaceae bacterium]|nr:hypothetical protein EBB07_12625 [Paenibacillaceae bacterium]